MKDLFIFLIFPGLLFTAILGMMASWLERKITARIQWRVGPPWYQSFADLIKLWGKELVVPRGIALAPFFIAPFVGLAGVAMVSSILGAVINAPARGFVGDLIVVIYFFTLPSLALIVGGIASRNTFAALGVSREMKLMIAYELPFILAIITAVVKAGMTIRLGDLVLFQHLHGSLLLRPSCFLAFLVTIICTQAKLGIIPFDIAEAETEVNAGPLIEYSGFLLAVFRLTKMMLLVVVPVFTITIFWGGLSFHGWGIAYSLLKYVLLLLIIIVIKNTNPRLRIDQALSFFWGPVFLLACVGMLLALIGH